MKRCNNNSQNQGRGNGRQLDPSAFFFAFSAPLSFSVGKEKQSPAFTMTRPKYILYIRRRTYEIVIKLQKKKTSWWDIYVQPIYPSLLHWTAREAFAFHATCKYIQEKQKCERKMLIKKRVEILKEEYEMKDAIEIHWRFDSN